MMLQAAVCIVLTWWSDMHGGCNRLTGYTSTAFSLPAAHFCRPPSNGARLTRPHLRISLTSSNLLVTRLTIKSHKAKYDKKASM
ncbi:hypothetical protein BGZ63DRAFT_383025 [Mariannaea sp. PMI_226]|nr:hypothetical protein BGZ63DRAFT_383025 [Mariannaea sp. PMI_226]